MSIIIMEPLTAGKVPSVRIIQESFASGKGLRGRTLRDLLEGSYSGQAPQGWFRDPDISMDVAQVFIHRPSGTAVVAHRNFIVVQKLNGVIGTIMQSLPAVTKLIKIPIALLMVKKYNVQPSKNMAQKKSLLLVTVKVDY